MSLFFWHTMVRQIEAVPFQLWLKPVEMQFWQVTREQKLPSELVGGAARFKTFAHMSALSSDKHLLRRGDLNRDNVIAQEMHRKLTERAAELGNAKANESALVVERLELLRLNQEYLELISRREFISTNELERLSLASGDVSYTQELEHLNFLIAQTEEYAKSTIKNNTGEHAVKSLENRLDKLQAQYKTWNDTQTDNDSGVKFEHDRSTSFREMAFGELDQIVKSDFVQQGSKKFSWERALDFLLNQSVNVFGNIEANESNSMDAEMGAMILDYLSTRLIDRGDYQTLIKSREQISSFIQQFEIRDQAKVRAGLIKNYLIDQYNFITKIGTVQFDLDPHSDLMSEELVSKSEAGLDIYDMVWHHWTLLLSIKSGKDLVEKNLAVQNILNSPLIDSKLGILRPRYIDPNGYSTYQHATLFLLAGRGMNDEMANVIRPWVTSEPLSRKKMGGVITAMNATVSRNEGIGASFANEEWVATPPSGKTSDSAPSFTAQVVADAINNGVQLSTDEMIRLIEWTLPNKQTSGWQPPKRVEPSELYAISTEVKNSYGVPIKEKELNNTKTVRWTGRLVQAFVTMFNQFV